MPIKLNRCECMAVDSIRFKVEDGRHWAACENCGRRTPVAVTRDEAARKWNQGKIVLPKMEGFGNDQ